MSDTLVSLLASLLISQPNLSEDVVLQEQNLIQNELAFSNEKKEDGVFLIKDENNVLLEVPFIHQIDNLPEEQIGIVGVTACGPSAITSSLNYLGQNISLMEVINKLPTTVYIKGDKFYNLYNAAQYFGAKTVKIGNAPKDFYETLNEGHPIVLNIQNYEGYTGHAVTIVGIMNFEAETETAKALIIHDPYRNGYRVFEYGQNNTLVQPEGYINTIGILQPFYLELETNQFTNTPTSV